MEAVALGTITFEPEFAIPTAIPKLRCRAFSRFPSQRHGVHRRRCGDSNAFNGLVGLDSPAFLPPEGLDLKEYLAGLEQTLIQQALDECSGVVARAAERLRIRRTTLVEKMRKYGLNRGADSSED